MGTTPPNRTSLSPRVSKETRYKAIKIHCHIPDKKPRRRMTNPTLVVAGPRTSALHRGSQPRSPWPPWPHGNSNQRWQDNPHPPRFDPLYSKIGSFLSGNRAERPGLGCALRAPHRPNRATAGSLHLCRNGPWVPIRLNLPRHQLAAYTQLMYLHAPFRYGTTQTWRR